MSTQPVDYTTHILIGQTSSGGMTVLWDWPHVPRQAEVQAKIDDAGETYQTYLLCTPTSIMHADPSKSGKRPGSRRIGFR